MGYEGGNPAGFPGEGGASHEMDVKKLRNVCCVLEVLGGAFAATPVREWLKDARSSYVSLSDQENGGATQVAPLFALLASPSQKNEAMLCSSKD